VARDRKAQRGGDGHHVEGQGGKTAGGLRAKRLFDTTHQLGRALGLVFPVAQVSARDGEMAGGFGSEMRRQRDRPLERLARLIEAPEIREQLPAVEVRRPRVRIEFERPVQAGQRGLDAARQLVESTEIVEDTRPLGLQGYDALVARDALVDPALRSQLRCEVEEQVRLVGIGTKSAAQARLRPRRLSLPREESRQCLGGGRELGVLLKRRLEGATCGVGFAAIEFQRTQIVGGECVVRVEAQRLAVGGLRLVVTAERTQRVAEVVVVDGRVGAALDRRAQQLDRAGGLPLRVQQHPQPVQRRSVAGRLLQDLLVQDPRLGEAARLVAAQRFAGSGSQPAGIHQRGGCRLWAGLARSAEDGRMQGAWRPRRHPSRSNTPRRSRSCLPSSIARSW